MTASDICLTSLDDFVAVAQPTLERALVARFGLQDGMEAAADALAYCCSDWERLRTLRNPVGYLFRVGESKAKRRDRRRRHLVVLTDASSTTDTPLDVDLQRALLRLKPEQRVAIVLVHAHGHTYAEAAALMDAPVTRITNHINRGLTRLRRLLEER